MEFPKYWAKGSYTGKTQSGRELSVEAWGWSSDSKEDAVRVGQERAKRAVERVIDTDQAHDYEYGNRPLREEVISTLDHEGSDLAAISRNRYGSLVLNTANVMFVDVDFPHPQASYTGCLDSILIALKIKTPKKEEVLSPEEKTLKSIEEWASNNPTTGFRLYRTHSGYRLLMTHALVDPISHDAKRIFSDLNADPLYCKLTENQACYRARLSPKPWRMGLDKPPATYPYESTLHEDRYKEWVDDYSSKSAEYSTCALQGTYGPPCEIAEIQKIIDYHDTKVMNASLPLA